MRKKLQEEKSLTREIEWADIPEPTKEDIEMEAVVDRLDKEAERDKIENMLIVQDWESYTN